MVTDHPFHLVRELLDMGIHRNKGSLESNVLPLQPTQPLGPECGWERHCVPKQAGCLWLGDSYWPTSFLFCRCWKKEAAISNPQQGRVENAPQCMHEGVHVFMCGPRSKGWEGTSLQNNIKKLKHFPLRKRITAHGILAQPEKWVVTPPFH